MKLKTRCGQCGKVYLMDASHVGKTAQCKNCRNLFTMVVFEDQPATVPPSTAPAVEAPQFQEPPSAPVMPPPQFQEPQSAPVMPPPQFQAPNSAPAAPLPASVPTPASQPGKLQPASHTQTVVCPKCNFTADIPRVTRKLKLRCQECGHRFLLKPEPKSRPGRPLPTEKAPKAQSQGGTSSKAAAGGLLLIVLLLAVLVAGPSLFPELFQSLGLPNLLDLLPF